MLVDADDRLLQLAGSDLKGVRNDSVVSVVDYLLHCSFDGGIGATRKVGSMGSS